MIFHVFPTFAKSEKNPFCEIDTTANEYIYKPEYYRITDGHDLFDFVRGLRTCKKDDESIKLLKFGIDQFEKGRIGANLPALIYHILISFDKENPSYTIKSLELLDYIASRPEFKESDIDPDKLLKQIQNLSRYLIPMRMTFPRLDNILNFTKQETLELLEFGYGYAALYGQVDKLKYFIEDLGLSPNAILRTEFCEAAGCMQKNTPLGLALRNQFYYHHGLKTLEKYSTENGPAIKYLVSLTDTRFDIEVSNLGVPIVNGLINSLSSGMENKDFVDFFIKDERFLKLKISHKDAVEGLLFATAINHVALAEYFIERGGRVEYVMSHKGDSINEDDAFMVAIVNGSTNVLSHILNHEKNLFEEINFVRALKLSTNYYDFETFKILASSKKYDFKNESRAILNLAASRARNDIVEYMLYDYGLSPMEPGQTSSDVLESTLDYFPRHMNDRLNARERFSKTIETILNHPDIKFDQFSLLNLIVEHGFIKSFKMLDKHPKVDIDLVAQQSCLPYKARKNNYREDREAFLKHIIRRTLKVSTPKCFALTAIDLLSWKPLSRKDLDFATGVTGLMEIVDAGVLDRTLKVKFKGGLFSFNDILEKIKENPYLSYRKAMLKELEKRGI